MGKVFISVKDIAVDEVKWIDARYALQDSEYGKKQYETMHVKNAVHWDLSDDLSDLKNGGGRHPLPTKEALTTLFEKSGLHLDDQIVVYDDGGSPFATRAWWILQYAGFKHAFVLLEGIDALKEAGVPMESDVKQVQKTSVKPEWQDELLVLRPEVEEIAQGKHPSTLVDARANARYRGEHEPLDRVAGHIPTALNFDWEQLKQDGVYDLSDEAKAKLEKLAENHEELTVYCGSGVTATPIYAMLTHLGYDHIRLYAGSYSDWVSKEDAVVETGENEAE